MNAIFQLVLMLINPAICVVESKETPNISIHLTILEQSGWRTMVMVRGVEQTVTPQIQVEGAQVVSIHPKTADISTRKPVAFFILLKPTESSRQAKMTVTLKECPTVSASCDLPLGVDLSKLSWETWHQGKDIHADDVKTTPPTSVKWVSTQLPKLWQELGVTWARVRFVIPESLRGMKLWLRIGAIDDRDVTFLNGELIGRTDGWDIPRNYEISGDIIRWGQENELYIAVDNVHAGGGIHRAPLMITTGELSAFRPVFTDIILQEESQRKPSEPAGERLPLRRMVVCDGVLYYEDGGEVALWGVNYYPQSWQQYQSLKKLGIDHRRSIDEDFEDFARMGINIIRIHVFDTEISDGDGNLIHNDHLDVLDYLIEQCNRHGIYLMLTPMAWWGSPGERPDSFSRNIPKQAMSMWPECWQIQANYLRQFLTHENPYTGHRLVDEPCLALFEIINEPTYWTAKDVINRKPGRTGIDDEASMKAINGVYTAWRRMVPSEKWQTLISYNYFRYEMIRRYIDTMVDAIRSTGAYQPIAYMRYWEMHSDIYQAIADSRCDAITTGGYPGGLPGEPINDDKNLLNAARNWSLDARFAKKARLVYEFDAAGTINLVNMYPAMARHWRNVGVQVACQFQYDARAVSPLNWDWPQHYLNLWHTPEKIVSFLIGGEVFRRLPRGAIFPTPPDNQVFPPGAVSFEKNAALLCSDDSYMQARPTDWKPIPYPENPGYILTVGSCPYFDYNGTGVVELVVERDTAGLRIYPDVEKLRYALRGSEEAPLTKLHYREHPFRLHLPGWAKAIVERFENNSWIKISDQGKEFIAKPGLYRLIK